MLVGRDQESALLDDLVAASRTSDAGVLVLRGEPGIGKTALITELVSRTVPTGPGRAAPTVLRVQGYEVESQVAFGGLTTLLAPLLHLLPSLVEAQRSALAGALHLSDGPSGDRLATGTATLNLISAAAEEAPVLVLVDDAHWLDLPSLEAIAFASRRMQAERVAVVLAARGPEDTDPAADRLLASLPSLPLAGLPRTAVVALLAAHDVHLDPARLDRHLAETSGNPLALLHLAGRDKDVSPVHPAPIGRRLELAFGRRLQACSQSTRIALLLLAVSGSDAGALVRLLDMRGRSVADLEAAEVADLVTAQDGPIRFTHPLIRSAVYQLATPAERREVHRAMADVVASAGAARADERAAWHLAAATALPDARIAATVDAAAVAAVGRRSYATAMDLYETAARLSPAGPERVARLIAAADLSLQAGRTDAGLAVLRSITTETDRADLLSQAVHLRCRIEMWAGHPAAARDMLLAESVGVAADQPVWAAIMLSHAALLTVTLGEQSGAVSTATAAVDLVAALPDELIMPALVVQALTCATDGQVPAASALLERCDEHLMRHDPLASDQALLVAALAEESLERPEAAMRWYRRATGAARETGAAGLLPFQLNGLAMAHWRRGEWAIALSTAAEAADLAEETGWMTEVPNCLVSLALVEAGLARGPDCTVHARRAVEIARSAGTRIVEIRADLALALLDLGAGSFEAAARRLHGVSEFAAAGGLVDPILLCWAADGVEAGVRAGHAELTKAAVDALATEAERSGRPTALARAARARALLAADGDEAQAAIDEALGHHGRADWPFEEARTRLVQGELLRRDRKPARARAALTRAGDLFQRLGATAFAQRAADELRAAGGARREAAATDAVQLTPQEVHVAIVVSEGASNVEAASRLFLSPKTVEYHLSNIYRKVGVRSRGQLTRAVADGRILLGEPVSS